MTTCTDPVSPSARNRAVTALLAVLLALALLATACGGSDDDADEATSGDRISRSSSDSGDDDAGTDTSDVSGDAAGAADDAEAGFSTAPTDDSADAADATEEMADEDGGFFGTEPDEPDPNRLEANTFTDHGVRPFVDTRDDNRSTFALDVDTGSYVVTRRWLDEGVLPPEAAVRVEEFVNAFDYDYRPPSDGLDVVVDGGPSPYDPDNILVRIGVQAAVVDDRDRPPAALTFVVDTSGSMDRDDRLGLVKEALTALVDELDSDDTVAIVTYGDRSAIVLEPTSARFDDDILDAIADLRPGGSTNLEAGLETAYELAEASFVEGGINRLILASDGVANVGTTDAEELSRRISDRAIGGIQLVTVGFGMGNYNDTTMEQLADRGDGFYAYVDTRDEAERLFEEELIATLAPVARDARIQVEFDEDTVDEYRLIGFENRGVLDDDFRNDAVDAGELSSGHTVTALYELDLDRDTRAGDELGEVRLRWQEPETGKWIEVDVAIEMDDIESAWRDTDHEFRLAATVAVWAELLRGSPHAADIDPADLTEEAMLLDGDERSEQTEELVLLIERSVELW